MSSQELLDPEQRAFLRHLLREVGALPLPDVGLATDHVSAAERISALADAGVRELWEWRGIRVSPPRARAALTVDCLARLSPQAARDQRELREVTNWLEDALGASYVRVPASAVGDDVAMLAVIAHYYAARVFWSEMLDASWSLP